MVNSPVVKCLSVQLSGILCYFFPFRFKQCSQPLSSYFFKTCCNVIPNVCCKTKCNFIHVQKKLMKLTTDKQNCMYISCSNQTINVKSATRKKFNPLRQAWLSLLHRLSPNTQSLTIITPVFSVKNFTQFGKKIWRFWVDTQVLSLVRLICMKFRDAAQTFCKKNSNMELHKNKTELLLADTVSQRDR